MKLNFHFKISNSLTWTMVRRVSVWYLVLLLDQIVYIWPHLFLLFIWHFYQFSGMKSKDLSKMVWDIRALADAGSDKKHYSWSTLTNHHLSSSKQFRRGRIVVGMNLTDQINSSEPPRRAESAKSTGDPVSGRKRSTYSVVSERVTCSRLPFIGQVFRSG